MITCLVLLGNKEPSQSEKGLFFWVSETSPKVTPAFSSGLQGCLLLPQFWIVNRGYFYSLSSFTTEAVLCGERAMDTEEGKLVLKPDSIVYSGPLLHSLEK